MKIFNCNIFKDNLLNHHKYVDILQEKDTEKIAKDLIEMIQDSLEEVAPIKQIQMSNINLNPLSTESKELISQRNAAHKLAKEDPTVENV